MSKANLKAAKVALDAEDYGKAIVEAQTVLASDSQNYFARLFLGRAFEKQEKIDDAAKTYIAAAKSKPDDSQAWLGLCSVYEAQGSAKVDDYREAAVHAAGVFANADDQHRCQTIVDKLLLFAKQHGNAAQYVRALEVELPGSPVYHSLEGRVPHPSHTYVRIAEITEDEEAQHIKREISERRTRIGARVGQVTTEVKREVLTSSRLEDIYQQVINWSNDDEVRRQYEEKLLERAYETLVVLPMERKATKLDQVLTLAEGMVVIKHPFRLAWDLVLDSRDMDDLDDFDVHILRDYVAFFPEAGLANILQTWLSTELSPFPQPSNEVEDGEMTRPRNLSAADRLLLMADGMTAATEQSTLAYRLVSEYYLHLDEYESAIDITKSGLAFVSSESLKLGMSMQNTEDALSSVLGTALVHYQAPRNHLEARRLFETILQRKAQSTPALIGLGLIFEETEDYHDAITFFTQALNKDKDNVKVGTELAWCRALCGDYSQARQELADYLPSLKSDDPRTRDLRAQVQYRIGVCIWQNDTSKAARRDRSGAYAYFLSSIKANVNFAPAYTSLGDYYSEYAKDKKRARQCYQKAFELSAAETDAAEKLARSFADQGDWEIVEVIAQRVIDSGRARPPPGSKRKGISWPYSALGYVQMNKQEYNKAIVSFLAALRIRPDEYQSYVGLGESYHNSGRYNSALRTFTHAVAPPDDVKLSVSGETWFAWYMLANVHRELGEYDEAIMGLEKVLQERPSEFGVQMSLLQTFVEKAWRCPETALFGQAVQSADEALRAATSIAKDRVNAFNVWKAVGDASSVFSWVQSGMERFPTEDVRALMRNAPGEESSGQLVDLDEVTLDSFGDDKTLGESHNALVASILAYKRAIVACTNDIHAQAVGWYNLGWIEHRAHTCSDSKPGKKFLRTAVRCFKRAIELEAGNSEFWNALGVVTTTLNPKVAQHAFVRSLHLNELNVKVWTNLGVLYLLQHDHALAHQAFGRAQSTDPSYAHAWVGEGLIALLSGDAEEALSHFTHAFEISDSSSIITRRQYSTSSFDHLLSSPTASNDPVDVIQPIFALEQLCIQSPHNLPYRHLAALFLERVGDHSAAIDALTELGASTEAEYEASETLSSLARFAQAKCDLSRNQLAARDFIQARENSQTALDLSSDADNSGLDVEARRRLRLFAHLTAGLASHNLQRNDEAISMFRTALHESDNDPDVTCLLVKVLWAHGGTDEKSVACEQLFECVEKHPEHIGSVTLLGAIAAINDDVDTAGAVTDDLLNLRTKDGLSNLEQDEIEGLLHALAGLTTAADAGLDDTTATQAAILLKPGHPQTWARLSKYSEESYAAKMALKMAQKAVPPSGDMEVEELGRRFAGVGTSGDAQRAISLAPWDRSGWQTMRDATAS